ncbi:MAG TPA: GGDEF domain-containing protein [Burkholderiales bacterium]|nr:GGDEF domain-containing protein [Burkholderiales bacterium]
MSESSPANGNWFVSLRACRDELRAAALPGAVLVIAGVAALVSQRYSTSLGNIGVFGPYAVLIIGTAMAVWFNRGRAFIALVSMLVAFIAYRMALAPGDDGFPARAVLTAAAIFVPANILIVLSFKERGIAYFRNYRWMLLGLTEILLTAWIATAGRSALSGTAWHEAMDHWLLRAAPTPFLGRVAIAAALVMAVARAWEKRLPLDIGMVGAVIAFFLACEWANLTVVFGIFVFAAGATLLLAVLQESHRMAFRDELTGLPGRRALEEKLVALGPSYAIAMVDVDHFKKFNDTHGHDTGDQVLKLVGAKLAEVGGGKAFRYGGEEFAVVFPDQGVEDALPHLEKLRRNIEDYRMSARTSEQRRAERRPNSDRRTPSKSAFARQDANAPPLRTHRAEQLSVTVSIGVAQRTELLDTPSIVIKEADAALYRAKGGGRNRVST